MSVGLFSLALASVLLLLRKRERYQTADPVLGFVGAAILGAASLLSDGSRRRNVVQQPQPSTGPP